MLSNKQMILITPEEEILEVAKRFRLIRRRKKLSQEDLARRSGVSLGSLKRFEATGMISLISLTKLCRTLGIGTEIEGLFAEVPYMNIDEVINERKKVVRKRSTRR